jgi:hypothetical protein
MGKRQEVAVEEARDQSGLVCHAIHRAMGSTDSSMGRRQYLSTLRKA